MPDRAVIGVSFASLEKGRGEKEQLYLAALRRAGLEPLPVRPGDEKDLPALLRRARGWVFTGGDDIAPELFGEEPHPRLGEVDPARDRADLLFARAALAEGIPVLGICLGAQLLTVAAGGTLVQDIPSQVPGALPHSGGTRHAVRVEEGSHLAEVLGSGEVEVNSFHHQSVKRLGGGFRATARSSDGVVEAIERPGPWVVGVQWHPEREGCAPAASDGLFAAFARAVRG